MLIDEGSLEEVEEVVIRDRRHISEDGIILPIIAINKQTGMNLTPIFNEYLRHADVPALQLKFDEQAHTVAYRWKAGEKDFAMPVRAGDPNAWQLVRPTSEWQMMPWAGKPTDFEVATDLYYVYVDRL